VPGFDLLATLIARADAVIEQPRLSENDQCDILQSGALPGSPTRLGTNMIKRS
jgi:hypothetical protein